MKIRFKTADGLECVKECPGIESPITRVMSPLWQHAPNPEKEPERFMEYRAYEFRGEVDDGIPTVHELLEQLHQRKKTK